MKKLAFYTIAIFGFTLAAHASQDWEDPIPDFEVAPEDLTVAEASEPAPIPAATGTAETATLPLVTTLLSDGSTNEWTQADLIAALQLLNRKYHREVEKPTGREAWHGKLIRQEVDTEREVKREIYEDGTVFEFPFEKRSAPAPKTTLDADNIPPGLAAARKRRAQEKATTNIVTVTVGPATP